MQVSYQFLLIIIRLLLFYIGIFTLKHNNINNRFGYYFPGIPIFNLGKLSDDCIVLDVGVPSITYPQRRAIVIICLRNKLIITVVYVFGIVWRRSTTDKKKK